MFTLQEEDERPTQMRPDFRNRGDLERTDDDFDQNRIESTLGGASYITRTANNKDANSRSFESPTMSISSQKGNNVQVSLVEALNPMLRKCPAQQLTEQNSFEMTSINSSRENHRLSQPSDNSSVNGCCVQTGAHHYPRPKEMVIYSPHTGIKLIYENNSVSREAMPKFFNYNWIRNPQHPNSSQRIEDSLFRCEREHLV